MLASDYIVEFLIKKGITDIFGYPGGMVTYLMESLHQHRTQIHSHLCYHEQGAALAACGYAQISGRPGVAYATSGPGATNLITGIANSFFDSIPCIFITGQVNVSDIKSIPGMRQNGFQETDIVSVVKPITKYAVQITDANQLPNELEKAYSIAMDGRMGPVLLDIPMNIQRNNISTEILTLATQSESGKKKFEYAKYARMILGKIKDSKRPVLILGAGLRQCHAVKDIRCLIEKLKIPVITSMIGVDIIPTDSSYAFGFLGAYGHRWANHIIFKSDLIITLGTRMDVRQTGSVRKDFAPQAAMIRVDIDRGELQWTRGDSDINIQCNAKDLIQEMNQIWPLFENNHKNWLSVCKTIKDWLGAKDKEKENLEIADISKLLPAGAVVTTDVGQNQVWVAQSFRVKNQRILFSGGLAAMGYSLPAAIGAYYACKENVFCFTGDGGLQMNIQELEVLARERLPIKIFLINNSSLGMIRHFQEMYFGGNYTQTIPDHGYAVPDFCRVAEAYGIKARNVYEIKDLQEDINSEEPVLFNVICRSHTYVYPKLAVNHPLYDQDPLIDRRLLKQIQEL